MNKKQVEEKIEKLITAISADFEKIKNYKTKAPKFETDKLLGNIRALYEYYTVYNYLNSPFSVEAVKLAPEAIIDAKFEEEQIKSEQIKEVDQFEEKSNVVAKDLEAEKLEDVKSHKPEPKLEREKILRESPPQVSTPTPVQPVVPPIAEKIKPVDTFVTLNDVNADLGEKTLAGKLQKRKVLDLNKAVPLHEKFLYINELFKSDGDLYKSVIENLNSLNDISVAQEVLNELSILYNWDEKSQTVKQFKQLIERKFN